MDRYFVGLKTNICIDSLRRALNALRKRRSDKHMICCLSLTSIILIAAGVGVVVLWRMFSDDMKHLGPLIILGPILLLTGIFVLVFMLEICVRLRKQIKRVMDPSLLKTSNFHEVKHWIEPGTYYLPDINFKLIL